MGNGGESRINLNVELSRIRLATSLHDDAIHPDNLPLMLIYNETAMENTSIVQCEFHGKVTTVDVNIAKPPRLFDSASTHFFGQ